MVRVEELDYDQKTALWVIGRMDLLESSGAVTGWGEHLKPKGTALFDQLAASGFAPHPDDAKDALNDYMGMAPTDILMVFLMGYDPAPPEE